MRLTTYAKYVPQLADAVNLQDLLDGLSDFLLQSGFAGGPMWHPYWGEFGDEDTRSLDALKQAILQALAESGQLTPEMLQVLRGESTGDERRDAEIQRQLAELLDQIVQRLIDEGYLNVQQAPQVPQGHQPMLGPGGQAQSAARQVEFNLTGKGIDFLGYRALRHLLGSIGKSSFGSHDTAHLATGVEAEAASKEYEFGDVMNIDVPGTLRRAIARSTREQTVEDAKRTVEGVPRGKTEAVGDAKKAVGGLPPDENATVGDVKKTVEGLPRGEASAPGTQPRNTPSTAPYRPLPSCLAQCQRARQYGPEDHGDHRRRADAPPAPGVDHGGLQVREVCAERHAARGEHEQRIGGPAGGGEPGLQPGQGDHEDGQVADHAEERDRDPEEVGVRAQLHRLAGTVPAGQGAEGPDLPEPQVERHQQAHEPQGRRHHPVGHCAAAPAAARST